MEIMGLTSVATITIICYLGSYFEKYASEQQMASFDLRHFGGVLGALH